MMWKQAFWLAKKEWKYQSLAFVITLVAVVFLGGISSLLLEGSVSNVYGWGSQPSSTFLVDFIFIGLAPAFASVFMSQPYMSYHTIKDDPLTKRMALLRALPIPVSVIALSRTIFMLVTLVVMSVAFHSTITLLLPDVFFEWISRNEYMMFILVWFGFALALGGMNPLIEYGTSGKFLHIFPFVYMSFFIGVTIFIYLVFDQGMVETVLYLVRDLGGILVLISLLIGGVGCYGWNSFLANRLRNKDFL